MQAQRKLLDAQRWHFQHGPIDLVIRADGDAAALASAHAAAWQRFEQVLPELVQELPQLRLAVSSTPADCPLQGPVARRMWQACKPFANDFITPMAAVAGSVAQEIIACYQRPGIARAWVNNGGDIAMHLTPGQSLKVGLYADIARLDVAQLQDQLLLDGQFSVDAAMPVRGVATSGWRGRSFSMGIADSVTVLARTAAQADAAATVIANAVNVNDACVQRAPAASLKDDSDLGQRLVTTGVPPLAPALVLQALQAGLATARSLQNKGLIYSALLVCQQQALQTSENAPSEALQAFKLEHHGLVPA
ncbi:MAG: hypothetical protein RLZZ03_498 [Pseudomonadota bacterium]|jgi:ApbE superfamily uncharacterized protein (UPF0280 family)